MLDKLVRDAIAASIAGAPDDADPVVRPSKFADYQVNGALPIGKALGRPPREIAEVIANHLLARPDVIAAADVAGPGFINVSFTNDFLAKVAASQATDDRLGVAFTSSPERIVVDYGGPNVAKEMHVGHLRTTIIGDAITRILMFAGHHVIRQNHLGDWGTQFGMLIEHMLDEQATGNAESMNVNDLEALYRAARTHFDGDEDFKERARKRVVLLQSGDEESVRLWNVLVDESKQHFDEIFRRLGTLLTDDDYRGESMYNDQLDATVAELDEKGLIQESEGALCTFPEGFKGPNNAPLPLIVRKSNGGYGYAATDLAALRFNRNHDQADVVLYVTDGRQAQHFAMVISTGRDARWLDDQMSARHVPFGMVLGKDGKPFKTRDGGTVRLADLLDEAEERAKAVLAGRANDIDDAELDNIARTVGIGAVKWMDLKNDRATNYIFDLEAMTSFDGNTGPYIQYATTRALSVLRKANESAPKPEFIISEASERELVLHLAAFDAAVQRVLTTWEPHHLCSYLFELAGRFSAFYENCPVLNADGETRASRLALCALTARVLQTGLGLLGIETLERM